MNRNQKYISFLNEVKDRIRKARLRAYQSVNQELIRLYWEIGKTIADRQKQLGWGSRVIDQLAADLRQDYPGNEGFSVRNLKYMNKFYTAYHQSPIVQPLVAQLPWSHHLVLLDKVKDPKAVAYYIQTVKTHGWSKRFLMNRVELDDYGRNLPSKKLTNFSKTLPATHAEKASELVKNSYSLEFLGVDNDIEEREFEGSLINHIRDFIVELGKGFTFIGNQYRLALGKKEYFIDLLFFHRHLRCLIAIELKMGEFKPEYAGKMNFYLNLLDDQVRNKDENPSIGIILCKSKDHLDVEYALRGVNKPMGVADYILSRKLPKNLVDELPSPMQLKKGMIQS